MLHRLLHSVSLIFAVSLLLLAGCSRDDGVTTSRTLAVNIPNEFARYVNRNAGLPSGDYTVVVATAASGQSGNFTLTVAYDNGSEEIYRGSWTNSAGQDKSSTANPSFDITLQSAGGLVISAESTVDTYLYLLKRDSGVDGSTDRTGPVFAENDNAGGSTTNSAISIAASLIDSASFGKAYYDTIDPTDVKTTLQDWKDSNGFAAAVAAGRVVEPRFRDTKDLGYGRGMRVWTTAEGDFYSFVENFQVRTSSGNEYTDLNLDALINDVREHHFGTNAIEYSTWPYGPGEPCGFDSSDPCAIADSSPPRFTKFYTFDATQGSQVMEDHANEFRLDIVDLDGRGARAMPGACVFCHGGTVRPLRADGSYRDNCYDGDGCNGIDGDVNAKLQLLEVPSFAFWPEAPFTRAEEEIKIRAVNLRIYCTYPGADPAACAEAFCIDPANSANCDGNGNGVPVLPAVSDTLIGGKGVGAWSGDFAREMAEGWYDDPASGAGTADFDSPTFRADYVPPGWDPALVSDQSRVGADTLFLEVVQPICFVCHSRRGIGLGPGINNPGGGITTNQNIGVHPTQPPSREIDFSTYERFMAYADQIKDYVYDRGIMPLSLRGYDAFWNDPDKPVLLASHINRALPAEQQIALNAAGVIDLPGAIVADAGPDRSSASPLRLFAAGTRFADSYRWEIISTPSGGEAASLADSTGPRPLLSAPVDGDYVVQLTASNSMGDTATDTVNVKVNSSISPTPADIVFSDITTMFNDVFDLADGGDDKSCAGCHQEIGGSGAIGGVPVYWTTAQPVTGTTLYREVLARIDFDDPENSILLTKPSGKHHYGARREGFDVDNPADRYYYDLLLNWIMAGARFDANNMREP